MKLYESIIQSKGVFALCIILRVPEKKNQYH